MRTRLETPPLRVGSREVHLDETLVMGVVNVTPDSFSDGGNFFSEEEAVAHAHALIDEGADILDFGGESTRPGAEPVELEEELRRVVPVIEALAAEDVLLSVDTYKAPVAEAALDAGADIVNDISGLQFDAQMAPLVAERGVPVVIMHILGTPRTMQSAIDYDDVVEDILVYFDARIDAAVSAGVEETQIVVDPGIGFGKTVAHNYEILRRLHEFGRLERPLLLGTSRKSFIGAVTGRPAPERIFGTASTVAWGAISGAHIVRVHDVAAMKDVVRVADAIRRGPTDV